MSSEQKSSNQLMKVYNINVMHWLRALYNSFKETPGLKNELKRFVSLIKKDETTDLIYKEFNRSTKMHEDAIFKSDATCLSNIPIMVRMEIPSVYSRLTDDEKVVFWKKLIQIIRYHGLLNSCGEHVGVMENLGMEFVAKHQGKSPEDIQKALVQDMLSDGKMMNEMIKTFQKPGAIENIINNIGPLIRGQGQDAIDLSGLLKAIKPEDIQNLDKDFKEMQDEMKNKGGSASDLFSMAQMFKPTADSAAPISLEPSSEVYSLVNKIKQQVEAEQAEKDAAAKDAGAK
jgi:hypothetical protein